MTASDGSPPRYSFGVPRELVHKRAVEQVLLTHAEALDAPGAARVRGQLPRAHAFFNDTTAPHYDLALWVELCRQAAILIAHRFLEAPLGHTFVFSRFDLSLDSPCLAVADTVVEAELDLSITRTKRRADGSPAAYSVDVALQADGVRRGAASGSAMVLPPRLRLRRSDPRSSAGRIRATSSLPR